MRDKYFDANCMGYALKKNKWIKPYTEDEDFEWYEEEWIDKVFWMIKKFKWLPIDKDDMKLGKKYIAFRWSDSDFHFMVRLETGHWRHKPGWNKVESISTKKVFANAWPGGYDSNLYLFEVL
jgi:hypothetical protein